MVPKRFSIFFGEMHDNTHQADDPDFNMEQVMEKAQSHLDFYAAAYYPTTSPAFSSLGHPSEETGPLPLNIENWKTPERIEKEWKDSCAAMEKFNKPGKFVTFPGYEWQGNAVAGDHNVFFFDDYPELIQCDTLEELYRALKRVKAIAIPHHTAYLPGFRGKDWSVLSPELSPFCEIYSVHGSSEGEMWGGALLDNAFLAPDLTCSSYSAALKRGCILGAIGSTDNWGEFPGHYGRGLAAVLAENLSREGLWEAFSQRRVYAVTGDRIKLDFTINDKLMGSCNGQTDSACIRVDVEGEDAIEYVEIVKNEKSLQLLGPPESPLNVEKGLYKMRFEYGWGPSPSYAQMPPRNWSGEITVKNGRIKSLSTGLVDGFHKYSHNEKSFTFSSLVSQKEADYRHHNSFVLEFELDDSSVLLFDINGCKCQFTPETLLEESYVHFYTDESRQLLKERYNVDTGKLYRQDVVYGMAYKFKIHKLIPQQLYSRSITVSDKTKGPCHYRIRVRQRNGQMAMSSPIWFK
ncbi:MAG: hypothetical protein CSA76_03120 [Spirochaetales bacterium]|nr:MAG: hypothetical protein CSA76_03120 [Spirochaetales bacterium]